MELTPPRLDHVCDIDVELDPALELGPGRAGQRRIIPIVGGQFDGPKLRGRVLHLGADWQTVHSDGLAELDTRYALETHDGAVIEIRNFGYRHGPPEIITALASGQEVDPARYYMRTHARLETGDARYAWVNKALFVGTGARLRSAVRISLFEIM